MKNPKFTVWHDLDLHDVSVYISIEWEYYPGYPATRQDPEETPSVDRLSVNVPDELEYRREEINWSVEDNMEELQDEALEHINGVFERQRSLGNEYT